MITDRRLNWRALGAAVIGVGLVLVAMLIIIFGSRYVSLTINDPSVRAIFRASYYVTILGGVLFGGLFGALIYFLMIDRETPTGLSTLYPSFVAMSGVLFAFFILASVGAVDALLHDLRPRWMLASQPEVRVTYATIYAGVIGTFGWILAAILRGRGFRFLAILVTYSAIVIGVLGLIAIAHGPDCREAAERWQCAGICPVAEIDQQSGISRSPARTTQGQSTAQQAGAMYSGRDNRNQRQVAAPGDRGGASRFFYVAKASRAERGPDNDWPTVKPLSLMRHLIRLVAAPGELVIDPFAGSGTTLIAAGAEGCPVIGIELSRRACQIAADRLRSTSLQMAAL